MSNLYNKSKVSIQAASALYKNDELCNASVHCSYYACVQLSKHIFLNKCEPPIIPPRRGIHEFIASNMVTEIGKIDINFMYVFNSSFVPLRVLREEADYDNTVIDPGKAEKAYKTADKIYNGMKKVFSI
jgi:hypothetical protein